MPLPKEANTNIEGKIPKIGNSEFIETINRILQRGNPWKFWQIRDTRTLYSLVDMQLPKTAKHHCLYDCYNQILGVQASFAQLGL